MGAQTDKTLDVADEQVNQRILLAEFIRYELEEIDDTIGAIKRDIVEPFTQVLGVVENGVRHGGRIFLFGNGGSAAHAQHLASELVVRYKVDRRAIPAIALTADSTLLTACGNDIGFNDIFARQIVALGRTGDIALGISTSGRSHNVIRGLREARLLGMKTIGFTGGDGGELFSLCDAYFLAPSKVTARIQEMHILFGHMLCKALEQRLGLV